MKKNIFMIHTLSFVIFVLLHLIFLLGIKDVYITALFDIIYNLLFVFIFAVGIYILVKNKHNFKEKKVWLSLIYLVLTLSSRILLAISYMVSMSNFD